MTDAVLIDLAVKVDPAIEVVFIDTGYHFPETLETVEEVRRRYGLNLRIMTVPPHDEELWKVDPENCCSAVKVGQLDRALAGKAAWMSGLRRDEAATRVPARPSSAATSAGLVKVNPIATWTDADVDDYIADHDVPVNPLLDAGLPVDRLHALHRSRWRRARTPARAAGPAATRPSAASTSPDPLKASARRGDRQPVRSRRGVVRRSRTTPRKPELALRARVSVPVDRPVPGLAGQGLPSSLASPRRDQLPLTDQCQGSLGRL